MVYEVETWLILFAMNMSMYSLSRYMLLCLIEKVDLMRKDCS